MSRITGRMFAYPQGLLGRLGGMILALEGKPAMVRHVLDALQTAPGESILEVGFGPGIGIRLAAERVGPSGFVAGADPSDVMIDAATSRNSAQVDHGRVDLERADAAHLPFPDARFDKAFAMYTVRLWRDIGAGLREVHRTLKPGGRLLLAARKGKGLDRAALLQQLHCAGFLEPRVRGYRGTWFFFADKPGGASPREGRVCGLDDVTKGSDA